MLCLRDCRSAGPPRAQLTQCVPPISLSDPVIAPLRLFSRLALACTESACAAREDGHHLVGEVVHEASQLACAARVRANEGRGLSVAQFEQTHLDANLTARTLDPALDHALGADGLPAGGRDAEALRLGICGEPARVEDIEQGHEPEVGPENVTAFRSERCVAENVGDRDAVERALGCVDVDDDRRRRQLFPRSGGDIGGRDLEGGTALRRSRRHVLRAGPVAQRRQHDREREQREPQRDERSWDAMLHGFSA